ncbi:hypothetical protein [Tsukamurella pseudospumae]|uniref:hypothetical protein n=1 Tax=Tsukamurella pseudospumae TaxID=239498 RepID=UPI000AC4D21F|nr:hypothetical protein [Tsukamurella pseudospumae]
MTITYGDRDALVDVDCEVGTVTVTPTRTGTSWTVQLGEIEAVGVRYSTLMKRGRCGCRCRTGMEAAHGLVVELRGSAARGAARRRHGSDRFAATLAEFGISIVTLDGKGRPTKGIRPPPQFSSRNAF